MPDFLKILVYLVVFFLPTVSNLVMHSASTILVILTLLGMGAWLTRKKRHGFEPGDRRVVWSFAGYFFACLFFYLVNGLFRESASLAWDLDHEARFLAFGVILYLFHRTGLRTWTLWYGTALAAIASGVYAAYYVYGISAGDRATGAYHAIAFADVSLAAGFISLTGLRYFHDKHPALAALPLLSLASGIFAAFLSGTRGALVAIPVLGTIFFIQLGSFRRPWRSRLTLVLAVALLSTAFYHLPGSSLDQRVHLGFVQSEAFFSGEGTGEYVVRLGMWQQAWRMFLERPLTGWGKEGYPRAVREKADRHELPETVAQYSNPHSLYLTNMAAYGITGLLMALMVFITPLSVLIPVARSWGPSKDIAYAGIMHVAAFMLFAVTETIFYRNININIYMILLAAILTLIRLYQTEA